MGCKFTIQFHQNENFPGQGKTAATVFEHIKLTQEDLDKLFTTFDDIDSDGSGMVKMDEFFAFFRLEKTEFNVELFRIFDTDGNGELSFLEYVCVVWNFLTLDNSAIGHYIVYVYCGSVSGKDVISNEEIINMIRLVHGATNFETNQGLKDATKELRETGNGKTINDLVRWMHDNPMITNPILMVYSNLRQVLWGVKFWRKLSKVRTDNSYLQPISYVIDYAEKEERAAEEERELDEMEAALQQSQQQQTGHPGKQTQPKQMQKQQIRAPRKLRARRGSLLEQARSGKHDAPQGQGTLDTADGSAAMLSSTYQSKRKSNGQETKIIKRARRNSLTKALSFVKGIGSGKSRKQKPPSDLNDKELGKKRKPRTGLGYKVDVEPFLSNGATANGSNASSPVHWKSAEKAH